ncbi:MAG TPA: hypothetical protein VNU48_04170 [Burkholderiaceae bacterium]|nr:hypothetical protein [Burkholderiaceae bacterium]
MMGGIAAFLVAMAVGTSGYFTDDQLPPDGPVAATSAASALPVVQESAETSPPAADAADATVVARLDPSADEAGACAGSCSDSEAGYAWAEAHRVGLQEDCAGASEPFNEGCRLYVEIQTALADHDDEKPSPGE